MTYWESRQDLFGLEKYTLRMTLSEALCDDVVAIQAGVFSLLPHPDLSGRYILFVQPCRHTREGYTSESMVSSLDAIFEQWQAGTQCAGSHVSLPLSAPSYLVFTGDNREKS